MFVIWFIISWTHSFVMVSAITITYQRKKYTKVFNNENGSFAKPTSVTVTWVECVITMARDQILLAMTEVGMKDSDRMAMAVPKPNQTKQQTTPPLHPNPLFSRIIELYLSGAWRNNYFLAVARWQGKQMHQYLFRCLQEMWKDMFKYTGKRKLSWRLVRMNFEWIILL